MWKEKNKHKRARKISSEWRCKLIVLWSQSIRWLDRALIGKIRRLILFLLLSYLLVFCVFWGLSLLLHPLEHQDIKDPNDIIKKEVHKDSFNGSVQERGWGILSHFFDPGNLHMASSKERWLATFIAFFGSIMFGGLIISNITNILQRRVEQINSGQKQYRFRKHLVILGWDDMVVGIIKNAFKKNPQIHIILQTSHSTHQVKKDLDIYLDQEMLDRLVFYYGNRNSEEDLRKLDLNHAESVYVIGEKEEYERDSKNLQVMQLLPPFAEKGRVLIANLNCFLLIHDRMIYHLTQDFDLSSKKVNLILLNPYEEWGRRIFANLNKLMLHPKEMEMYPSLPCHLDGQKNMVLIIAGFGKMGQSMLVQAIRFLHASNGSKTKVILIDKNISNLFPKFKRSYPGWKDLYTHKLETWNDDFFSDQVYNRLKRITQKKGNSPYFIISFRETSRALKAGFNLPIEVYQREIPVLVRQDMPDGIRNMLEKLRYKDDENPSSIYKNIKCFGAIHEMFFDASDFELRESLAKAINTTYDNKLREESDLLLKKQKADQAYRQISSTHKWSNRYGADGWVLKLQTQNIFITPINTKTGIHYDKRKYEEVKSFCAKEEVELLAKMEHDRWVGERITLGWSYAPLRNDRFKTRDNMIQWCLLKENGKENEKEKDHKKTTREMIENIIPNINLFGYLVIRKKK